MRQILALVALSLLPALSQASPPPIYKDPKAPIADRVSDLVSRMTLEEKIDLVGGNEFSTKPNARLGIPELKMTDGPIGVRWMKSTAFPSGISMGASFNRDLVYKMASAMGLEARAHGRDMLLGPCVGISRVPFGGRNFESMGEDPFLTSELVASYVHALNDQKVVGSVKHFGLNDQEYRRMDINSVADERTMHEIHLVAFERAVKEGVGTVMASYNKLNGKYASENPDLLTGILKKQWGFTGFVVSDWGATHSTVPAALAGLDLEMPNPQFFDGKLLKAVQTGEVPESNINDKVSRILTQIFKIGLFDGADKIRPGTAVVNSPAHQAVALQLARESQVLLKNINGMLPLDLKKIKKLAVIGPNADTYVAGGGSSQLDPIYSVTPLAGLRNRIGAKAKVQFSAGVAPESAIAGTYLIPAQGSGQGLFGEYFANKDLAGAPAFTRVDSSVDFWWDDNQGPDPRLHPTNFSIRWTGTLVPPADGDYTIQTNSDDGVRLWLDGKLIISNWTDHGSVTDTANIKLQKGRSYKIRLEYYQAEGGAGVSLSWISPSLPILKDAVNLAADSDAVVLAVGFNSRLEGEAQDRDTFTLPKEQIELIKEVTKVNPNTIVVINTGNPLAMESWMSQVPAIIYAWYPGQEGGNALADILLGNYNPSGRLPVTMLKHWKDSPAFGTYPEQNGDVNYKEGIYVGYRHFDKVAVDPEFPFGFGLSYTSFLYGNLEINAAKNLAAAPEIKVTATITNKGERAGAEVVQLYVQDLQPKVDRPVKELKGFEKIFLQPGESKQVTFTLDQRSFAYYDVITHSWVAQPGRYALHIGASSRDIRLNGEVVLTSETAGL